MCEGLVIGMERDGVGRKIGRIVGISAQSRSHSGCHQGPGICGDSLLPRGGILAKPYRVFQKSLCKGLGLLLGPRPPVIRSAKFLRECFRKVAHSRNTLRFAKSALIISDERSFFTFFVPLQYLDHIPFALLSFG